MSVFPAQPPSADLVLVGGGHAHAQVLRRWMMKPLPGVRLSVVVDRCEAIYSGMVPGFVAGDYAPEQLQIDLVPLARRARARVILAAATRLVPERKRIELEGRAPIGYDVASLDVGSTVRGLDLPGVLDHTLPTRPIRAFVDRLDQLATSLPEAPRVALVGGGAAGVELAFTLDARLRAAGCSPVLSLVNDTEAILPGSGAGLRRRAERALADRGIRVLGGRRVSRVEARALVFGDGEKEGVDLVVWATGAAPVAVIESSDLPKDEGGFVRTTRTYQVEGQEDLFAVGDCAAPVDHPWVTKAGVYAVRAGPVLDENLRARLAGGRLRAARPQRDFLALLNLGGRRALGGKWGLAAEGTAVWRLKDWIDRRFMARFQVLGPRGELAPEFPTPEDMGMEEMPCGGCAAKIGASPLERALARLETPVPDPSVVLGLDQPDDAAAFRTPAGDVVLATVDGFRAFTDDPWWVGRVAAINALSDVYAKGGRPRHALAMVTVPDEPAERAEETLYQVLAGLRAALDPLAVTLVGGHSTVGLELFVGLAITGDAEGAPLPLGRLVPGDALILTAPLGTGVVLAADMQGRARGVWLEAALAHMAHDNRHAGEVALRCGARAATDVSGFGLAGHLGEMLGAAGQGAVLQLGSLPSLPGALELLSQGQRSHYHEQNAEGRKGIAWRGHGSEPAAELLFDPQTSGGLLIAFSPERADEALAALHRGGDPRAARIGSVLPRAEGGTALSVES